MLRRASVRLTRLSICRPVYSNTRSYASSEESGSNSGENSLGASPYSGGANRGDVASTLHYSGLPVNATREKIMEALSTAGIAGVSRVNLPTSSLTHGSRGFAFVTFESPEAANTARTQTVSYEGATIRASAARSREDSQKLRLYIGDLDYNLKDTDLKAAIESAFGPVEYVNIATHRGLSKGFAFASMQNGEDAEKARAVGRLMIDGKPARIESVKLRDPRERFGDRASGRGDSYGSDRGHGGSSRGDSYGSDRGYGGSSRGGYGGSSRGDSYGSDRGYGESSRGGYGESSRDSYGSGGSRGSSRGGYGGSSRGDSYGSDSSSSY